MANPNPKTAHLSREAGPGRPKGSKNRITPERLKLEIGRVALSNIVHAFDGVHGNRKKFTLRELKAMPEDFQRCISSLKVKTENLTAGDDEQDIVVEIKLWDKVRAQELMARSMGLLKDNMHVTTDDDVLNRLDAWKTKKPRGE